jgi:hypothetical protein
MNFRRFWLLFCIGSLSACGWQFRGEPVDTARSFVQEAESTQPLRGDWCFLIEGDFFEPEEDALKQALSRQLLSSGAEPCSEQHNCTVPASASSAESFDEAPGVECWQILLDKPVVTRRTLSYDTSGSGVMHEVILGLVWRMKWLNSDQPPDIFENDVRTVFRGRPDYSSAESQLFRTVRQRLNQQGAAVMARQILARRVNHAN